MLDVLAVAASARRGGNSDTLLEAALDVFRERGAAVQTVVPSELAVTPCRSCSACLQSGVCPEHDDMAALYGRFCEADCIVVASPIYFTALPGQFKVMIDRFQCFWHRTYVEGRPPTPRRRGMFLCVAAVDRERYYRSCLTTVKTWLSVLNVSCEVSRFFPGLDAAGDARARPDYLAEARRAAEFLAEENGRSAMAGS